MLSIILRQPQLHSNVATTVSACGIYLNNKTLPYRPISHHLGTFEANNYNIGDLITSTRTERQTQLGISKRTLSTLKNKYTPVKVSKDERSKFMAIYPDVLQDLAQIAEKSKTKETVDWLRKAVDYNMSPTNGKCGLISVLTHKSLVKDDQLSAEKLRLSHLLGWCVELLHCALLIADDMVDNGTARRGQLCWQKLEEVGVNAISDALMIENCIYELLKKHFRHLDCYVDLIELFRENTFKCISGQSLDMLLSKRSVDTFNMDIYNTLVMNKTSNHFFSLPIMLGLHLAGGAAKEEDVKDRKIFDACEAITIELGQFLQIQNDFLDCFGNPDVTGKIGTDIQANKCSWLAVQCMERANPEQRAIMEECYGQYDPQKIARVRQVYMELNLPNTYAKYEEETYNRIKTLIHKESDGLPREALLEILNTLFEKNIK
ncbi:PREDICTED: farnesyl pyrophosphate synthase-like [Rhagoletis zephyria]|uniref:farnesyl pyrophosphate synthase-like n=1 Tax=Rhagoletis zephyria TaxID=28612 RepID=UPI0008119712|nr:PREDICTED: farnesyl pyrophosphate synthase-like [Rhagoletis zephyria]